MRVLVIDNFDSFTYNLVQYLGALGAWVEVFRNNALSAGQVMEKNPDRILISPGPGSPDDAGISREVIRLAAGRIPLLGVCLGHQCLGEVYGGRVVRTRPMHGKTSRICHDGKGLFTGLPQNLTVARYHSLVVDAETVGPDLTISARTDDGLIMGLRHQHLSLEGIQFHPESFMTEQGMSIIDNFLKPGKRP